MNSSTKHSETTRWLPLGVSLFGMAFYILLTVSLSLAPADLNPDPALKFESSVLGEAAALLHYRASIVLMVISAFASSILAIAVLFVSFDSAQARFHLRILVGLASATIAVNIVWPSEATHQLAKLACVNGSAILNPVGFCAHVTQFTLGIENYSAVRLDFHQLLNVPLAIAAACIGYSAFAVALAGRRPKDASVPVAHEKLIALTIAMGSLVLAFSTLSERAYAKWAFSGFVADTKIQPFIDSITYYAGATSTALLSMIWLFAIGILSIRIRGGFKIATEYVMSPKSAVFSLMSVLAPILFAIFQHLF